MCECVCVSVCLHLFPMLLSLNSRGSLQNSFELIVELLQAHAVVLMNVWC